MTEFKPKGTELSDTEQAAMDQLKSLAEGAGSSFEGDESVINEAIQDAQGEDHTANLWELAESKQRPVSTEQDRKIAELDARSELIDKTDEELGKLAARVRAVTEEGGSMIQAAAEAEQSAKPRTKR
ncbi:MAG: hypothetical protein WD061_01380 [Candidatus Saccharimonadales bacterium]